MASVDKWENAALMVLEALKQHKSELVEIRKEIQRLHIDTSALKVKSTVWGVMGGTIPAIMSMLYSLLRN